MKLKIIYIAIIVAISNLSFADGHDEEAYKTYTGEVLQCNFNEGKDLDDALNMVRKDWYKMAQSYPAPYEGNVVPLNCMLQQMEDMIYLGLDSPLITMQWER